MDEWELRQRWYEKMVEDITCDFESMKAFIEINIGLDAEHNSLTDIKQDLLYNEWATEEELNGHQ